MSETHPIARPDDETGWYEIHVKGHLEDRWAAWFEGLSISRDPDGSTRMTGAVVDQAALHGLLRKVRDLGLPLVAVTSIAAPRPVQTPEDERR